MAAAILYKKRLSDARREQLENEDGEENTKKSLDAVLSAVSEEEEITNEAVSSDPIGVLFAHEKEVFGNMRAGEGDQEDYHWFDDETDHGYPVPYAEGIFSLPFPSCAVAVCRAHVEMVRSHYFELTINATIGLVAIAFTMQMIAEPDLSRPSDPRMHFFVTFVKTASLVVFAGEMLVKIIAEGTRPLRYWTGPESSINMFDSSIVVLSFALMGVSGGAAILPVLRLARLVKLLNRSPETRRVLYGIIAGFKAMASIVVLLTMIMFLYAIIGVKSFGENDPVHFGTVPISMLTLFVASTCSSIS